MYMQNGNEFCLNEPIKLVKQSYKIQGQISRVSSALT